MSKVTVERDKKGPCWKMEHLRSGYHEEIWLTDEEVVQAYFLLRAIVRGEKS